MAKYLIQLIIAGGQVLGKAFTKAIQQEINASQQAAKRAAGGSSAAGASRAEANMKVSLHINQFMPTYLLGYSLTQKISSAACTIIFYINKTFIKKSLKKLQ